MKIEWALDGTISRLTWEGPNALTAETARTAGTTLVRDASGAQRLAGEVPNALTAEGAAPAMIGLLLEGRSPKGERAYQPRAHGGPWGVAVLAVGLMLAHPPQDEAPKNAAAALVHELFRTIRALPALQVYAAQVWQTRRAVLDALTAHLCDAFGVGDDGANAGDVGAAWNAAHVLSLPPAPSSPAEGDRWIAAFFEAVTREAHMLRAQAAAPSPRITTAKEAAALAWGIAATLADESGAELRHEIAAAVLAWAAGPDAPASARAPAIDARALASLAAELRTQIGRLREALGMLGAPPADDAAALAQEGGILAHDARFAAFLESTGEAGKETAAAVREGAARRGEGPADGRRWEPWTDPHRFGWALSRALFLDVVAERLREKATGLAYPVHVGIVTLQTPGLVRRNKGQLSLNLRDAARSIVLVPDDAAHGSPALGEDALSVFLQEQEPLRRGLELMSSIYSHRLIFWFLSTTVHQKHEGFSNYGRIDVVGGWAEIARLAGMDPEKDAGKVRTLALAMAHFRFAFPGGRAGNLLTYDESTKACPGRKARVSITLGPLLLPGAEQDFKRTDRRIVPHPGLPPLVGGPQTWGQQATLSLLVVRHLRALARDLVQHGGAVVTPDEWLTLAESAGMPRASSALALRVLERWTSSADGGAFLERVEAHRYHLARSPFSPAHAAARAALDEAGRMEIGGEAGGKASAAKRRARLFAGPFGKNAPPKLSGHK